MACLWRLSTVSSPKLAGLQRDCSLPAAGNGGCLTVSWPTRAIALDISACSQRGYNTFPLLANALWVGQQGQDGGVPPSKGVKAGTPTALVLGHLRRLWRRIGFHDVGTGLGVVGRHRLEGGDLVDVHHLAGALVLVGG